MPWPYSTPTPGTYGDFKFNLMGWRENAADLPMTGYSGLAFLVGGPPSRLYLWTEETTSWKDMGVIEGVQGPIGPAGPQGATGPQGPIGPRGPAGSGSGGVYIPAPLFILSNAVTIPEGNDGVTNFIWTLTLERDGSTADIPYAYAVTTTAGNAADFGGTLPAGSGVFAPNETVKTITIPVSGDTAVEPTEAFTLTVTSDGITPVTSTGTIANDDTASFTPLQPSTISYTGTEATGTTIAYLTTKTAGTTLELIDGNGGVTLSGSDANGWTVKKGAGSVINPTYVIRETGPTGAQDHTISFALSTKVSHLDQLVKWGVNFGAGAGGSTAVPGVLYTNYNYGTNAQVDMAHFYGARSFRMPFLEERVITAATAGVTTASFTSGFKPLIDYILTKPGTEVIADPHRYGKFFGAKFQLSEVSKVVAMWNTVFGVYKGNARFIPSMQNEPIDAFTTTDFTGTNNQIRDQRAAAWWEVVRAWITAMRAAGWTQELIVPGMFYQSAEQWAVEGNAAGAATVAALNDPLVTIEAHQYVDGGSGTTTTVVANSQNRFDILFSSARSGGYMVGIGETATPDTTAGYALLPLLYKKWEDNKDVLRRVNLWAYNTFQPFPNYLFGLHQTPPFRPSPLLLAHAAARDAIVPSFVGTADAPEEDLISPANVTLRSTYNFVKQGVALQRPPQMTDGNGIYWPEICKDPCDLYPDRAIALVTTDHTTGSGGMFMYVCVGDWRVASNWKLYEEAVAAGYLYDKTNLPTSNPIYGGAWLPSENASMETLCVNRVGSTWVATYQVGGGKATPAPDGTGNSNQSTVRATSPDLINWTGTKQALAAGSNIESVGDGHKGYFCWGPNPFPGLINPATGLPWPYMGYRLEGGQSRGTLGMYGWEEPIAGHPTFLKNLNKWNGRVSPSTGYGNTLAFAAIHVDPRTAKTARQGISLTGIGRAIGSGASIVPAQMYELCFNDKGDEILYKPQLILPRGSSGSIDALEVSHYRMRNFGDKRVVIYEAAGSTGKVGGLAISDKRNPGNTWFEPLVPAIPTTFTTKEYNFKTTSNFLSEFDMVKSSPSVADPIFTSDGMTVTLALNEEIWFFEKDGFIAADIPYVDVYLKAFRTVAPVDGVGRPSAFRIPYCGFFSQKTVFASQTDMFFWSNQEATGSGALLYYQAFNNGAQPIAGHASDYFWSLGYGTSSSSAGTKKSLGMRWFPQDDYGAVLGLGGGMVEMEQTRTSTANNYAAVPDKTKRFYRGFGFKGMSATPTTERAEGLLIRGPAPYTATVDTTLPTITSAATASQPENGDFVQTLTANESVTFSKRTGADSALFTLVGTTLTLPARNFEVPTDADTNNTYICNLTATDTSGNARDFTVVVTVTDVVETAVAATLGNLSQLASTANTAPYAFVAGGSFNGAAPAAGVISLGTAAANRVVLAAFSGRATTATTVPATVTLTPDAGSPITMTLIGTFRSTLDSPFSMEMFIFAATVPVGTTATVVANITPSSAFGRAGLSVAVAYGINPTPLDTQTGQMLRGTSTGPNITLALDKKAGGVAFAACMYSNSGATFITCAAEATALATTDTPVNITGNNATSTWTGIANPQTSLSPESTGSGISVVMALAFGPA